MLECIEHLNKYGDYYLPEIENLLLQAPTINTSPVFKSGVLGNYFVKVVQPDSGKKMKALASMDPTLSDLSITTLDKFLKQLNKLEHLLEQSKRADLTKLKTSVTLSRFLKMRLGDTFRFLVAHNQRHILQAERAVAHTSQHTPLHAT